MELRKEDRLAQTRQTDRWMERLVHVEKKEKESWMIRFTPHANASVHTYKIRAHMIHVWHKGFAPEGQI